MTWGPIVRWTCVPSFSDLGGLPHKAAWSLCLAPSPPWPPYKWECDYPLVFDKERSTARTIKHVLWGSCVMDSYWGHAWQDEIRLEWPILQHNKTQCTSFSTLISHHNYFPRAEFGSTASACFIIFSIAVPGQLGLKGLSPSDMSWTFLAPWSLQQNELMQKVCSASSSGC